MGRRKTIVLGIGALVICALLVQRTRLQNSIAAWLILREDAPGQIAMQEMVESSPDPGRTLHQLWDTRKIVQREFVLDYLRYKMMNGDSPLWPSVHELIMQAAACGDSDTSQAALTVLEERNDPQGVRVAMAMLRDIDPDMRRNAVLFLERQHDKRLAPVFVQMLDDPSPDVRGFAAGALGSLTNQDFGLHFTDDEEATRAALASWKDWWASEQAHYAAIELPPAPEAMGEPVGPAVDFVLPDLSGNKVRLSDFRGKLVLLTFWATWCPPCIKEMASLSELHDRRGNDVVILAISADSLRDSHEHGNATRPEEGDVTARVAQFASENKLAYRVLLDRDGQTMGAYNGGDLPVGIWIDRQGAVRRRFVGARPVTVLEQMADAIDQRPPTFAVADAPTYAAHLGGH